MRISRPLIAFLPLSLSLLYSRSLVAGDSSSTSSLSFLWLGWLAGLTGWLARSLACSVSDFLAPGPAYLAFPPPPPPPVVRFSSSSLLLFLFLLPFLRPMYSFYSYTGAVPTCSSGSAGRSFALLAYRNPRISLLATSWTLRRERAKFFSPFDLDSNFSFVRKFFQYR